MPQCLERAGNERRGSRFAVRAGHADDTEPRGRPPGARGAQEREGARRIADHHLGHFGRNGDRPADDHADGALVERRGDEVVPIVLIARMGDGDE